VAACSGAEPSAEARAAAPAQEERPPLAVPQQQERPRLTVPRQQERPPLAERFDFERSMWRVDLPGRLDEVSGLATTSDGRLFAHDDERGRVHEIDPASGEVGKRFDLAGGEVRDDFEGIAVVGERFFLVSSGGLLYEFREVGDREETQYRVTDSGVGATCEVEGLDYHPASDALLLPCKASTSAPGSIVVHRIPIDPAAPRPPSIVVERSALAALGLDPDFATSSIAVDPGGSLVLASANTEALLEVDTTGAALSGVRFPRDRHPQPEGLAFGPGGALLVADERNGADPKLTAYGLSAAPGGGWP
jgi:uncharacterized protein YjiK